MKSACAVCLIAFTCFAHAKPKAHAIDPCDIQPVLNASSASNADKAKIHNDLILLRTAIINFGFEGEFSKAADDISQRIPEKALACRALLQEAGCVIKTRSGAIGNDLAGKLIDITERKGVCSEDQIRVFKQSLELE